MTFTVTSEHVYLSVILVLMIVQVWQWRVIYKTYREYDSLWTQIGVLAASISAQIIAIQQELNKKEDKKAG